MLATYCYLSVHMNSLCQTLLYTAEYLLYSVRPFIFTLKLNLPFACYSFILLIGANLCTEDFCLSVLFVDFYTETSIYT